MSLSVKSLTDLIKTLHISQDKVNKVVCDFINKKNAFAVTDTLGKTMSTTTAKITEVKPTVETEKFGKQFEMAICLLYGIEYDGKYKYGLEEPTKMKERLVPLLDLFPKCKHTAIGGGKYDFTAADNDELRLSAKTNKKGDKVAPQHIGQAKPTAFCKRIGILYENDGVLKKYIQENIASILSHIEENTFSSPIIYYHLPTDTIRYISKEKAINWSDYTYEWTQGYETWTNSTTLKVKKDGITTSILEIQFHSTNRSNMAIRWCFNKVLDVFKDNFKIISF